jgi:hypothetical protein
MSLNQVLPATAGRTAVDAPVSLDSSGTARRRIACTQ